MKRLFLSSLAALALGVSGLATEPTTLPGVVTQADAKAEPAKTEAKAEPAKVAPAKTSPATILPGIVAVQAKEPKADPAKTAAPAVTAAPCYNPCTPCCNPCDSCCENNGCRGRFLADVGFLILKPYWKTNPALFIGAGDFDELTVVQKDFTDATQFVPRLSFGYVNGDGFGGRIGWWGFATSQTDQILNPAGDLDIFSAAPLGISIDDTIGGMAASMALRLNVWDFEVIQVFERGCWSYLLSAGIRYAHMSQDYNAVEFEADGSVDEILVSGHNFNGAGPTVSLQVRRDLRNALYLASTIRGSLLFGQGEQTAAGTIQGEVDFIGVANSTYDMVLPVGEIELGAGWQRPVRRGVAFVEAGIAAQAWIEAGNASRSDNPDVLGPILGGTTSDPTLGLFGFYAKAGLTY